MLLSLETISIRRSMYIVHGSETCLPAILFEGFSTEAEEGVEVELRE